MARSIAALKQVIKTKARTFSSLASLLFEDESGAIQGSQFIGIVDAVATAQNTFENLADLTKTQIQNIADSAQTGNAKWIQAQIFKFQYGDVIEIGDDYVPAYPVIDLSKRIVTRCAVEAQANRVEIKVAKGSSPPEPLSAVELTALQDYYYGTSDSQGVGFAGVQAEFTNQEPDRIFIEGVIRFIGQYDPAIVKTNVITAIEDFLSTFQDENFGGTIKMSRLEDAIVAVDGVSRFEFTTIKARDFNTAFGSAAVIDTDGFYSTIAGYAISEDTASQTLTDKITTVLETA